MNEILISMILFNVLAVLFGVLVITLIISQVQTIVIAHKCEKRANAQNPHDHKTH